MCLYHRAILRRGARRNDPSLALYCACGLGDRHWPFDVHYSDQSLGRRVSKATLEVVGVFAVLTLPIVPAYLCHAQWIFRGETTVGTANGE
jgi:cytochrome bd-type quinol oxidase subunit 2